MKKQPVVISQRGRQFATSAIALQDTLTLSLLGARFADDSPAVYGADYEADGEVGDFALPPMLLLPAVENAIKHGPAAGHGGEVRVEVALAGEGCTVTIRNPGRFTGRRPGGEGVPTIERRLALAYGGGASLTLEADGDATVTTIVLPARAPIEAV